MDNVTRLDTNVGDIGNLVAGALAEITRSKPATPEYLEKITRLGEDMVPQSVFDGNDIDTLIHAAVSVAVSLILRKHADQCEARQREKIRRNERN